MAGKIEIRASGAKFRFVVLNTRGDKLIQSGPFDDKASARRAATSLVRAATGAEISDATKPAPAAKPAATGDKPAAKPAARPRRAAKPAAGRASAKG